MIRYQDRAKTREEAEEKALQLLLQIAGDVSSVETVTREGKTKEDEDFLYLNVSLKGKPGAQEGDGHGGGGVCPLLRL